ncbi:phosducin family protein [Grosmannia clavigera kw1407]|uniref:Phosducin family protein n=1 Tax=Grosmannia clavigera (strain kw1407 / UAMH 11150) TaxID=655863 RepID=F0XJ93_GROCL|nr:phosducin family protein [Grosmannia clavigera kw1407]EFX02246.1 phosducin family protein [Grosmannia clavigera kw1407]
MTAPVDQRIAVPVDDPNADTEWNDILRKHGVIPEKPPSPTPMIEEAIAEGRRLAHENRLEGKDLDELDEFEDVEDEDFLNAYRQQRMQELRSLTKKAVHGSVYPLTKPEYGREVTEASKGHGGDNETTSTGVPVLVLLTSSAGTNIESRVLSELWCQAAAEYGEVKFCEMRAEQAIEGYPERNCPTILVYRNGDIVKQVVTLVMLHGVKTNMLDIDSLLVEVGAVPDNDMRVIKRRRTAEDAEEERLAGTSTIRSGFGGTPAKDGDDDDDWD